MLLAIIAVSPYRRQLLPAAFEAAYGERAASAGSRSHLRPHRARRPPRQAATSPPGPGSGPPQPAPGRRSGRPVAGSRPPSRHRVRQRRGEHRSVAAADRLVGRAQDTDAARVRHDAFALVAGALRAVPVDAEAARDRQRWGAHRDTGAHPWGLKLTIAGG